MEDASWGVRIDRVRGLWVEGRRRDVDTAAVNFRLADELIVLAPFDVSPDNDVRVDQTLLNIAKLTDTPAKSLEKARNLGLIYPPHLRHPDVAWSAYEVLAASPERHELLARMAADPDFPEGWRTGRRVKGNRITADRARLAVGQKADRKALSDAASIMAALENKDTRREFKELAKFAKGVEAAKSRAEQADRDAERQAEREAKQKEIDDRKAVKAADKAEKAPRPSNPLAYYSTLVDRLRGLNVALAEATAVAGGLPTRPAHYREQFLTHAYEASRLAGKIIATLDPAEKRQRGPALPDPNTFDIVVPEEEQ